MSTWQEVEGQLSKVGVTDYGGRDSKATDKAAREVIRKAFLDLERKAAERDSLRELLLEQGAENAHLLVEIEQLKVQLATANSSFVAEGQHCEICAQQTLEGKERVLAAREDQR